MSVKIKRAIYVFYTEGIVMAACLAERIVTLDCLMGNCCQLVNSVTDELRHSIKFCLDIKTRHCYMGLKSKSIRKYNLI